MDEEYRGGSGSFIACWWCSISCSGRARATQQLAPDLLVVALLLAAREAGGSAAGLGLVLGILDGALVPFTLGASAVVLTFSASSGALPRPLRGRQLLFLRCTSSPGSGCSTRSSTCSPATSSGPGASYLLLVSPLAALYAAAAGLVSLAVYRAFA